MNSRPTWRRLAIRSARRVHLWIALCLGLHFALIATTGGLFIFHQELTNFARFWRGWQPSPGDVGPDRCFEAIAARFPNWDGGWLSFPNAETPYYSAYLSEESDSFWTEVFVDPGSGQITGTVNNWSCSLEGLLQFSIQLHIHLCAGEPGRRFVDCSVALLLVELVTGLCLWWPGWSRLRQGFSMRFTPKRFLFLYDWHRVSGALAAPFLLVMTLTGLLWGFPEIMAPLVYWTCGEPAPAVTARERPSELPREPSAADSSQPRCTLADVVQLVRARTPDAVIQGIHLPPASAHLAGVSLQRAPNTPVEAGSDGYLWVNRTSREVITPRSVSVVPPSIADRLVNDWAHPLHYGDFGGLTTKLLYLAACAAVDGLYFTGLWMWLIRRRKTRNALRSETLRVAAN